MTPILALTGLAFSAGSPQGNNYYYGCLSIILVTVLLEYVLYLTDYVYTIHGKSLVGEKVGKVGKSWAIRQNFPYQYS